MVSIERVKEVCRRYGLGVKFARANSSTIVCYVLDEQGYVIDARSLHTMADDQVEDFAVSCSLWLSFGGGAPSPSRTPYIYSISLP